MLDEKPLEAYGSADFLEAAVKRDGEAPPIDDEDEENEDETESRRKPPEDDDSTRDDTEDGSENTDDSTDDQGSKPNEDAPEKKGEDVPQLDPLLKELAKGNPKAEKRIEEIEQGIHKLTTETKQLKTELETTKPKAQYWDFYQNAFEDSAQAGDVLSKLIAAVAAHHSMTITDLLPALATKAPAASGELSQAAAPELLPEIDEDGRRRPIWERKGYGSEKEMLTDQRLDKALAALDAVEKKLGEHEKDRAAAQRQTEFKKYVDETAPKIIAQIEKQENGWKVTKGMFEKAIQEFPQLRNDPIRAIKAQFADDLAKHYAKSSVQTRGKRGHEMLPDTRGKGTQAKSPLETTAADVFAELP